MQNSDPAGVVHGRFGVPAGKVWPVMVHAFLDFELDEERFELRSRGQVIPTQGRVFAMIAYLLHARDRVVGKAELMRALWKDAVVSETAISQVVMLARKALGDEGESQRVIRTVRGRGFRFIAPVQVQNGGAAAAPPQVPAQPAARSRSLLLGRAAELRELTERLARAEGGAGGLVLIEGEPGIGKTTLAEALAAEAVERGVEVIWGRAWEEGGAPPFWPWIQVLRALTQREDAAHLRDLLGASAAELLSFLPELAGANEHAPASLSPPAGEELDGSRARFRQFDAITRLLRHTCVASEGAGAGREARKPRLIILDDLHAADDASIQLTRFLMPDLPELGLLLVGTYRDLELSQRKALAALAEGCSHNTLRLRGLGPAEVSQLLAQTLGSNVPPRWAPALHRLSAGNPLLVSELCSRIDTTDPGPLVELSQFADLALPERIASTVRRHLAELPAETCGILCAASALGREFSLPVLSALQGCSESELLELLAPALRRGIVRPANAAGRLIFSHALVCNAVYAELAVHERATLHRRIAELLEQGAGGGRPPLYEIAHHFILAAIDGQRRKAIEAARRAAVEAHGIMAYETAAGLYDRAAQLAELEAVDSALQHELLCGAGNAWFRCGELDIAHARFVRAANLARAEGEPLRFAQAVLCDAGALRSVILHDRARQQQLREALALLPPGDSEMKALLLALSTLGPHASDTLAERERTTLAAIEMARRLDNAEVLQWTLNSRHLALWGAVPSQDLIAITDEMLELGGKTHNQELRLDALMWRMSDTWEVGDSQGLRARHEYLLEVERSGSPWHRFMSMTLQAFQAAGIADFARARELSDRALALGLRIQDATAEPFHAIRTLFLDLHQGIDGSADGGSRALRQPPSSVPEDYRALWALSWAAGGHDEAARNVLEQVVALERQQLLLDAVRRQTLAVMAHVSALLGERAYAAELYRWLLPSAGRQLQLQAGVSLGPVEYYLGLLACLRDEREMAAGHFTRALAQSDLSRPYFWYAQYEYAQLLAASDGACARKLLREVQAATLQHGMAVLRARTQAALAQLERSAQVSTPRSRVDA